MTEDPASKRSISLPQSLLEAAEERARLFGYRKFSHYVQALIEADIRSESKEHVRTISSTLKRIIEKAKRPRKTKQ